MADLATLGAANTTGLTRREGWEVVVVHVPLVRLGRERVNLLFHLQHVERGDAQDLRLTALEDRRAVNARNNLDLGRERTNVAQATAIDANAVLEDALADGALGDGTHHSGHFLLTALELSVELRVSAVLDLVESGLTGLLVSNREGLGKVGLDRRCNHLVDVVLVVKEARELRGLLRGLLGDLYLRCAQHTDERLGSLEALSHDLFGGRLRALRDEVEGIVGGLSLDHHDGDVIAHHTTGNDHVEHGALHVGVAGEAHPLTVDERHTDATDGAGERQASELGRHRRRVDGEHVVHVVRVDREHIDDDLDLVTKARHKGRTQRTVDEAARENRVRRGTALSAEERTGNLAGSVRALLDIHGQREEVKAVARRLRGRRCGQQHRLAIEVRNGGAGGLLGKASGFKTDGTGTEGAIVDGRFGEVDFGTFHADGRSFSVKEQAGRTRRYTGCGIRPGADRQSTRSELRTACALCSSPPRISVQPACWCSDFSPRQWRRA